MKEKKVSQAQQTLSTLLAINEAVSEQFDPKRETFETILDISPEDMNCLEAAAEKVVQDKGPKEAADAYLFLATLRPTEAKYWLNLGRIARDSGDVTVAIQAFGQAAAADLDSPESQLCLAESLVEVGRLEDAVFALSMAVEIIAKEPHHSTLRKQAVDLRKRLKEKKEEKGGH